MNKTLKLLIAILATIFIAVVLILSVKAETRPRYSLSLPRAPFINQDIDSLPDFERPICWHEGTGYCDSFDNPYLIYVVTDWQDETLGGIWQSGDDCYLMMYYSQAEHPYVAGWLYECPELDYPQ